MQTTFYVELKPPPPASLLAEILDVDVGAGSGVVGEIPTVVVGIFVDHDGIAVPVPVTGVVVIKGRYAEVEAVEPEAFAVSSSKVKLMAAAKAAVEAAVFPGMIQVVVRIAATGIVTDPMVIVVNVRRVRVIGAIAEGATVILRAAFGSAILRAAGRSASRGSRTVRWDVAAAHIVSAAAAVSTTAALSAVLCISARWEKRRRGQREEQSE